jgi:hypothetical protein
MYVFSTHIQFDSVGYWTFLGTALYALEGTAFVLPIEHQMQHRENVRSSYMIQISHHHHEIMMNMSTLLARLSFFMFVFFFHAHA